MIAAAAGKRPESRVTSPRLQVASHVTVCPGPLKLRPRRPSRGGPISKLARSGGADQ